VPAVFSQHLVISSSMMLYLLQLWRSLKSISWNSGKLSQALSLT